MKWLKFARNTASTAARRFKVKWKRLKVNLEVLGNAEDVFVTLSNEGYMKRTSKLSFTRSGGELENTGLKEGDYLTLPARGEYD